MTGVDALVAVILIMVTGLCIMWALMALQITFSVPQFIFFGFFCIFLGVFLESYFAGTRELVLATAGMLILISSYAVYRGRSVAKALGGRRK